MQPLPIILSRPHGGLETPPEVENKLAITQTDLYNDCDLWVDQHFDFNHPEFNRPDLADLTPTGYGPGVLSQISMPIARALIDANRPLTWMGKPDGPVKSQTSYGHTIYKEPLSEAMQQQLLDTYWRPYHQRVADAIKEHAGRVQLVIDCHNMAQHGPTMYGDPGQSRPLICIANMGDQQGELRPERGWLLCPPDVARKAREIAEELFSDMTLLEPETGVDVPIATLNSPYGGSFVLAQHLNPEAKVRYQAEYNAKPPMTIMIEVNRGLFVGDQTAKTAMTPQNAERIAMIRRRLYQWAVRLLELTIDS